jgi:histidine triad (HIT) family protein
MARDPDCIFCKIVAGEIPAVKLAETELAVAFMDIGPISRGHALVVPREHYEDLTAMSPQTAGAIHELAARLAPALKEAVSAEGLNVLQNNGRVAGQVVPHFHVHLIPRWADDGLHWPWPARKADPADLQRIADQVVARLSGA